MRVPAKQLVYVVALAVVCGLCLAALVGGLAAGAIDGPARGADTVFRSARPVLYWCLVVAYAVGAVGAGWAALVISRGRSAA